MTSYTGGDAVADTLAEIGVRHVFVVASVHNLPMLDAIRRRTGIAVIMMRHEQAAVHAADAYHRVTGRLGVAVASTGPGAANAVGGLFEAMSAGTSVLMITGQNERRYAWRQMGSLHDAPRQTEMLSAVTRATWLADLPGRLRDDLLRAAERARTPVPGPVALEIPIDVQYGPVPEPGPAGFIPAPPGTANPDAVARVAALLHSAQRPLVVAGGGVLRSGAASELLRLCESAGAPVLTSVEGRGAIPEDHPLSLGATATSEPMRELIAGSDLVIAVGTHFRETWTARWTLPIPARLVHVDADPQVFGRVYAPEIAIAGDAREVLAAVLTAFGGGTAVRRERWCAAAAEAARRTREILLQRIGPDHRAVMEALRAALPAGSPVVRDSTIPAYTWGDVLLPILEPGTSLRPVSAAIGPSLPLAIGAAVGTGERTVVICGDGGFMLSAGELAVLAQEQLPITVCVFDDACYSVLKGIQEATFEGPAAYVDLAGPDFVALARSFGIPAGAATSAEEFEARLAESVDTPGPYLIEVDLTRLAPIRVPYVSGAPEQL
ncbi:thiamine pyrophosphate-binding protein [Pseudonocardia kongjuensis]|uniref:Thiamine pyrophosphate-binding protein n=1 Tax=Pseudonocardia kongjuensis TaxID=102227 RepID=A0ABP4I423_9PSEU